MQRPNDIVWFERIIIGTLVLGVLNSWLAWSQLVTLRGPAFLLITQSFTLAIMLALTLLTSRRRSNLAKWILVGLFVVGLPFVAKQAVDGQISAGAPLITAVQTIGQLIAYALLFTRSSRQWFKREMVTI